MNPSNKIVRFAFKTVLPVLVNRKIKDMRLKKNLNIFRRFDKVNAIKVE
jgi:hypothetical protein